MVHDESSWWWSKLTEKRRSVDSPKFLLQNLESKWLKLVGLKFFSDLPDWAWLFRSNTVLVINRMKRRNPPCAAPPLSSFPMGKNSTPRKEAHRKVDFFSSFCLQLLSGFLCTLLDSGFLDKIIQKTTQLLRGSSYRIQVNYVVYRST